MASPTALPARILRPQLSERLAVALRHGAVALVADAGFGKTTTLEQVAAELRWPAAWLPLLPADREPGHLLVRIVAGVRAASPGVADALGDRLATIRGGIDPLVAAQELAAEVERLADEPILLVLDDGEKLSDAADACAVIEQLIMTESPLRVALASRRSLPLRAARAEGAGRLARFGPGDLAFTPAECAELLGVRYGRAPEPDELDRLLQATEGWPLGVALGSLEAGSAGLDLRSRRALFRYLEDEVLGPLDSTARRALLEASLLPEVDKDVAAQAGEVFVRALDHGAQHFAFHPLLREFLQERFRAEVPAEEARATHRRVAATLAESGRDEEAMEHWLEGGDPAAAIGTLVRIGQPLLQSSPAVIAGWLDRLPLDVESSPVVAHLRGQLESLAGNHEAAITLLRSAVEGYRALGEPQAEWFARFALMDPLLMVNDTEGMERLAEGFDEGEALGCPTACPTAVGAANVAAERGDFDRVTELLERIAAHPWGAPIKPMFPSFEASFVDVPAGRLDDAVRKHRESLVVLEREDPFRRLPFLLWYLAEAHSERGEFEEAAAAAMRAEAELDAVARGDDLAAHIPSVVATHLARVGRTAEAELRIPKRRLSTDAFTMPECEAEVARATVADRYGDAPGALAAVRRAAGHWDTVPPGARQRAAPALATIAARFGAREEGLALLERTLDELPAAFSRARLLAVRAALRLPDDADAAVADLLEAWEQAGDARVHLLRREWATITPVVEAALSTEALDPDEAAGALLAAFRGRPELLALADHPHPVIARRALLAAAQSGHPAARRRVRESDVDVEPLPSLPLRVVCLGGFAVWRGDWSLDAEWPRPIARRLVRFLIASRDRAVPEETIFDALWAGRDQVAARRNLQVALSWARGVLDDEGPSRISADGRVYRLVLREGDTVDADRFEAVAAAALEGAPAVEALEHAASLWNGGPLPEDRDEEWVRPWRERLLDRYWRVLDALAAAHTARGDHASAIDALRRLVALDPLDESGHRRLMAAYARAGRRGPALRQFLECRRALVGALGVEPSEETAALQRAVLAGDPI